jgi:hypothetical protein
MEARDEAAAYDPDSQFVFAHEASFMKFRTDEIMTCQTLRPATASAPKRGLGAAIRNDVFDDAKGVTENSNSWQLRLDVSIERVKSARQDGVRNNITATAKATAGTRTSQMRPPYTGQLNDSAEQHNGDGKSDGKTKNKSNAPVQKTAATGPLAACHSARQWPIPR